MRQIGCLLYFIANSCTCESCAYYEIACPWEATTVRVTLGITTTDILSP